MSPLLARGLERSFRNPEVGGGGWSVRAACRLPQCELGTPGPDWEARGPVPRQPAGAAASAPGFEGKSRRVCTRRGWGGTRSSRGEGRATVFASRRVAQEGVGGTAENRSRLGRGLQQRSPWVCTATFGTCSSSLRRPAGRPTRPQRPLPPQRCAWPRCGAGRSGAGRSGVPRGPWGAGRAERQVRGAGAQPEDARRAARGADPRTDAPDGPGTGAPVPPRSLTPPPPTSAALAPHMRRRAAVPAPLRAQVPNPRAAPRHARGALLLGDPARPAAPRTS